MRSVKNNNGKVAIAEILVLILGVIAFSYVLGMSLPVVSAQATTGAKTYLTNFKPVFSSPGVTAGLPETLAPQAGKAAGLTVGSVLATASMAYGVKILTGWIFGGLGAGEELTSSASYSAAGGYLAASLYSRIAGQGLGEGVLAQLGLVSGWATLGIGLGVAAVIFLATFKKTRYDLYSFSCQPWDAPTGGQNCELCNDGDFPCTEYRCKSLGQGCSLENEGTSGQACVWKDPKDVKPPVIQPWVETLTTGYKYTPDNAVSPPDRGVKIVPEGNSSGCIQPFEGVRFGVTLDQPAKCKIDLENRANFKEMDYFFGGNSLTKYNHSQIVRVPSRNSLLAEGNISIEAGQKTNLFVKCEDVNGNKNEANFVFNFCVYEGPDTTAPFIEKTSIINGQPVRSNQSSVDLDVYVNEPAECKWGRLDIDYDNLENSMSCSENALQVNGEGLYKCSTTLTGLKDRTNNDFYFRCKDQPYLKLAEEQSSRNTNQQGYKFTLIGTQPLVILSVGPDNETISDSTDKIRVDLEVETTAGADKGRSLCYYSRSGDDGSYIKFYETGSYTHTQRQDLVEGDYTYYVRCTDEGGNTDEEVIKFIVDTDTREPSAVRVFRDGSSLKVITDEKASCVYDSVSCTYDVDLGIRMTTDSQGLTHSTPWNANKNLYVKCQDEFGNRPDPDQCSIIARPFEV